MIATFTLEQTMSQEIRVIALSIVCMLASCSAKYPSEARDALEALRKVQAATQVGVNYQQYGQLLIDAKAKTNAASLALPDGPLKNEFKGAIDAYADAATAWDTKFNSDRLFKDKLFTDWDPGRSLIPKYKLPLRGISQNEKAAGGVDWIDTAAAMSIIWQHADSHIKEIGKVLGNTKSS